MGHTHIHHARLSIQQIFSGPNCEPSAGVQPPERGESRSGPLSHGGHILGELGGGLGFPQHTSLINKQTLPSTVTLAVGPRRVLMSGLNGDPKAEKGPRCPNGFTAQPDGETLGSRGQHRSRCVRRGPGTPRETMIPSCKRLCGETPEEST